MSLDCRYGTNYPREGRRDCCFAKKLRVPSVDAGRFSISTKAKETINDAAGLWNPRCNLLPPPPSLTFSRFL